MRQLLPAVLFLSFPLFASAAGELSLDPVYATHSIGETFEVRVLADTGGEPVSAAEADIRFDPGALLVERVSSDGSIIAAFSTGPTFSNEEGSIQFAGWTAEPYAGDEGLLITITFKSLRNIVADVRFASGALLSSDSRGSNVLERMASALYTAQPREIPAHVPEGSAIARAGEIGEVAGADTVLPESPSFDEYQAQMDAGERIVARGRTVPNSIVTVYLSKDEMTAESSVISASDGRFTFVSDENAEEGVYRISADVETTDGLRSERSDRIIITVNTPGLSETAAAALPFAEKTWPLFAVLFIVAAAVGYFLRHALARRHRSETH